jgi:hypothetical protein
MTMTPSEPAQKEPLSELEQECLHICQAAFIAYVLAPDVAARRRVLSARNDMLSRIKGKRITTT